MASATMGLRRRVPVPTTSVAQSGAGGKRSRSENNNSPSQGNLNSLGEPAPKKSRTSTRSKSKELEMAKKIGPPLWSDPRPYAQIAGLSLNAQAALCSEPVGLPSPMSYMSATMATFVGNAASLGKSPAVSYLDISNMTGRPPGWLPGDGPDSKLPLSFSAAALAAAAVAGSYSPKGASAAAGAQEASTSQAPAALGLPKNFPNDSMFAAYQPWVIKTYGDLAKTKTITIKKYARILRTLRGEEVNSAENSKFRFWVKSKGFHIGQPEGYEAKPADRIIGRHAVTSPGLDPPLYVPTQPPHNKALNGAEGTIPPGRVYKKVAIVENFFDIIHAVHVDLEGRPGKHAGQKRTYRTITETYAFLPREAVTRFLLGCTECQRRPRTPSPTSLNVSTPTPPAPPVTPPITSEKPPSPQPATVTSSEATATSEGSSNERSRESSHPPESKSGDEEKSEEKQEKPEEKQQQEKQEPKNTDTEPTVETTSATTSAATPVNTTTSTIATTSNNTEVKNTTESSCSSANSVVKNKIRDEKYNPLSITNLLRKDPIVRRPPYPIATAIVQHIPEPEPLTRTPTPTSVTTTTATTTSTTSSAMSTEHSSASLTTTVTTTTSGSCHPRKLRMLPDVHVRRSTPSPLAASSQPRSWSPGGETNKCAPIDYSRPVGPSVQQTPAATGEPVAAPVGTEDSQEVQKEAEAKTTATPPPQQPATNVKSETTTTTTTAAAATSESSSESESEADDEQRGFSPAAGLIDTNLNLLATIQQLHCQVMLALTERLRPPVPASPVASAGNDS